MNKKKFTTPQMNDLQAIEVLHIYQETLYTQVDINHAYRIISGSYGQQILLCITASDEQAHLLELLQKMMHACKLTEVDYQVVVIENMSPVHRVVAQCQPHVCILFGMSLQHESFQSLKKTYIPFRFNQVKMLTTHTLQEINQDATIKSTLWNQGLKPIFNIA